jgi:hypothetical protein
MNWLVYLSGDDCLMDLISLSIPEILLHPAFNGRYVLFYESSEGFPTMDDVRNDAERKIALIRGISILVLNSDPGIQVEEISRTQNKREDCLKDLPDIEKGNFIISCDEDDFEEIQIRSPFESVYLVAAADDGLNTVICAIPGNFGTWEGFLRLFRKLESSTGNPVEKRWCSEDELDWFLYSACVLSSGEREESSDSSGSMSLMYLSEAESFFTILMQEWIKEKKRELRI